MKRRTDEMGALAAFEKSGHFFFNKPFGCGYDDGLVSAIAICEMLDRAPDKSMADLKDALPKTWSSPTMPENPRSRHRQRRARHHRGRQLGPGAGFIQQTGAGGGGREPGFRTAYAQHVRGDGFGAADASGGGRL
jgi:hypothetical protein